MPFDFKSGPDLGTSTDVLIERLRDEPTAEMVAEAGGRLEPLRNARDYERLESLAEEIGRVLPTDRSARKFYAQSLIDTGKASVALDVLKSAARGVGPKHEEYDELKGLIGRANKQIFIDAGARSAPPARMALANAIKAYREPYERTGNPWHGINLAAVLHAARRQGIRAAPKLDPGEVAADVLDGLERVPADRRDAWWNATKAEAHLALGQWLAAEEAIHAYVVDPKVERVWISC